MLKKSNNLLAYCPTWQVPLQAPKSSTIQPRAPAKSSFGISFWAPSRLTLQPRSPYRGLTQGLKHPGSVLSVQICTVFGGGAGTPETRIHPARRGDRRAWRLHSKPSLRTVSPDCPTPVTTRWLWQAKSGRICTLFRSCESHPKTRNARRSPPRAAGDAYAGIDFRILP